MSPVLRGAGVLLGLVLLAAPGNAATDGEGDATVLVDMEAGLAALRAGDLDQARTRFDAVVASIEMLWADSESARRVRSTWYAEGAKAFRGEPYERAAALLYRGVVELLEGRTEEARAYFKAGTLQDAFAEEEQFRCDFGLLFYLYALASMDVGAEDLARQALAEAVAVPGRPWYFAREPPETAATVLLVETGTAPRKLADGRGHSQLVYRRGETFREETVEIECAGSPRRFFPSSSEDLFFQAATRGGRAVERILEGKVVFRDQLESTGAGARSVAGAAGVAAAASGVAQIGAVGALADLIGGFSRLRAANARPQADTRAWSNLPDRIHVVLVPADGSCSRGTLHYLDGAGRRLPSSERTLDLSPRFRGRRYGFLFLAQNPSGEPPASEAAMRRAGDPAIVRLEGVGMEARIETIAQGPAGEERKSGIPGFEVSSGEAVYGRTEKAVPWVVELRARGGVVEIVAANDSRQDVTLESVTLDCPGEPVRVDPGPIFLPVAALDPTRVAAIVPRGSGSRFGCRGRIRATHGETAELRIDLSPLTTN